MLFGGKKGGRLTPFILIIHATRGQHEHRNRKKKYPLKRTLEKSTLLGGDEERNVGRDRRIWREKSARQARSPRAIVERSQFYTPSRK